MYYALKIDSSGNGIGSHAYVEQPQSLPADEIECTQAQAQNAAGWTVQNGNLSYAPSLALQAEALLANGLTINSTSTPAINGVYGCDAASQARASYLWDILRHNSNGFPTGRTQVSFPMANGSKVVFTDATVLMNALSALSQFILDCDQVALDNAGTLPSASVTIP